MQNSPRFLLDFINNHHFAVLFYLLFWCNSFNPQLNSPPDEKCKVQIKTMTLYFRAVVFQVYLIECTFWVQITLILMFSNNIKPSSNSNKLSIPLNKMWIKPRCFCQCARRPIRRNRIFRSSGVKCDEWNEVINKRGL